MKRVLIVLAVVVVAFVVIHGHGSASKWPTEADARGVVRQLLDERFGSSFVRHVPWCVPGIGSNEYECRVAVTYQGGAQDDYTTWFIRCDRAQQTCRIEQS